MALHRLTDGREEDKGEDLGRKRVETTRRYHEAMQRGRHPRSFPHRNGVWNLVKTSSTRLAQVQAGKGLNKVIGMDLDDAVELSRKTSNQSMVCFDADAYNSHEQEGQQDADGNSAHQQEEELQKLMVKQLGVKQAKRKLTNSVTLAKLYTANYESSEQRKEKISRRMSEYRELTAKRQERRKKGLKQSIASMPRSPQNKKGANNVQSPPGTGAPAMSRSQKNKLKGKEDLGSFLMQNKGFSKGNESAVKFLEVKAADESTTQTGSENGGKGRNNTEIAKRKTRQGQRLNPDLSPQKESDGILSGFSFAEISDKGKGEQTTELVEFAPSNVEGRLFYGSQIALEHLDGSFLTVSEPSGNVSLMKHPRGTSEDSAHQRNEDSDEEENASDDVNPPIFLNKNHTVLFTLVNLHDPEYVGPICSGDVVWLCIHPGYGQFSWKEGSILGSRVVGGANIDTVPIEKTVPQPKKNLNKTVSPVGKDRRNTEDSRPEPVTFPNTPTSENTRQAISTTNTTTMNGANSINCTEQSGSDSYGTLLPILTYLPRLPGQTHSEKSLDDLYRDASNIQRIQKMNRTAAFLGQWKISAASNQQVRAFKDQQKQSSALDGSSGSDTGASLKKMLGMPITNDMPIYLEQDWVYVAGADSEAESRQLRRSGKTTEEEVDAFSGAHSMNIVLKKLPNALHDTRQQYCVDRQGVFNVRLVQSKLQGSNAGFKSVEQTLFRARVQLKSSELSRNGSKKYLPGLYSGTMFSSQIRKLREKMENKVDDRYLGPVEDLQPNTAKYFYDRFVHAAREGGDFSEQHSEALTVSSPSLHHSQSAISLNNQSQSSNKTMSTTQLKSVASLSGLLKAENVGIRSPVVKKNLSPEDHHRALQAALNREIMLRETEAFQQRLSEDKLTPWYETVFQLKVQDQSLLNELYSSKSNLKTNALQLLGGGTNLEEEMYEKKRQQELEECMAKPIYSRLVEEDLRIKTFIDQAVRERSRGKKKKEKPPVLSYN